MAVTGRGDAPFRSAWFARRRRRAGLSPLVPSTQFQDKTNAEVTTWRDWIGFEPRVTSKSVAAFSIASTTYVPTVSTSAGGGYSLDATGIQATLAGGNATFGVSLVGTGSQASLTGGSAPFRIALTATGSQVAFAGGNATLSDTRNIWLTATGSQGTLSGGIATLSDTRNFWLTATGSQVALTGGTASLDAGAGASLVGTGIALALTGGTAALTYTANVALAATGAGLALTGGTAGLVVSGNFAFVGEGSALALVGGTATLSAGEPPVEPGIGGGGGFVRVDKKDRQKFKEWLEKALEPITLEAKSGIIALKGGEGDFFKTDIRTPFEPNVEAFRPRSKYQPKAKQERKPAKEIDYAALERARKQAKRRREEEVLLLML